MLHPRCCRGGALTSSFSVLLMDIAESELVTSMLTRNPSRPVAAATAARPGTQPSAAPPSTTAGQAARGPVSNIPGARGLASASGYATPRQSLPAVSTPLGGANGAAASSNDRSYGYVAGSGGQAGSASAMDVSPGGPASPRTARPASTFSNHADNPMFGQVIAAE